MSDATDDHADTALTDERRIELDDIALRWVTNQVYVDIPAAHPRMRALADDDEEAIKRELGYIMKDFLLSWMVLALAKPEQIPNDIGGMWEEIGKASPRAVNGKPIFFSGNILTLADCDYLIGKANQIHDAMQEAMGAPVRSED